MLKTREETYESCLAFSQCHLNEDDARYLCEASLGKSYATLIANQHQTVDRDQFELLVKAVEKRLEGEPIAYIVGSQGFWRYIFRVTPATLIPRPETETLVEVVLPTLIESSRVLDLGCGCGTIGLTLALEAGCDITMTDLSRAALDIAESNAEHLGAQASIIESNWFDGVDAMFDCIVSNPPYVAENDGHLLEGDLRFEPMQALVGGTDGLTALRLIIGNSPRYLEAGGRLAIEHGFDQGIAVQQLFFETGFAEIATHNDLSGHPRVTTGVKL